MMKTNYFGWAVAGVTAFISVGVISARAETAYFVMSGPMSVLRSGIVGPVSYVVAVSDPFLIQQARIHLKSSSGALHLVPHVRIKQGYDGTNVNFASPGHPRWDWHATELVEWTIYDPTVPHPALYIYDPTVPHLAVYLPWMHSAPSRVALELLGWPEFSGATSDMRLVNFPLTMEVSPLNESAVINVSTRGWVGEGERALIAGFVVQGGVPRNVLIRAIGPSLSAYGVVEPLADPHLSVFRGTEKIAENDDWKTGNLASHLAPDGVQTGAPPPWYEWLYPMNSKESAVQLSLAPGAYTVQVGGAGGTGIALVEVYDFDALHRPEPAVALP